MTQIKHIAFIMDGNGRWASKRGLPRSAGHIAGAKAVAKVISACNALGIKAVSLYAFSTENWKRPEDEIKNIFKMITDFNRRALKECVKHGYVLRYMGELSALPDDARAAIEDACARTADNAGMVINVAVNYGGKQEIVRAACTARRDEEGKVSAADFEDALYSTGLPPVDLLVRTGGEYRLSNFMLYQSAYAELFFEKTLWPDMTSKKVEKIVGEFALRNRRFGGI